MRNRNKHTMAVVGLLGMLAMLAVVAGGCGSDSGGGGPETVVKTVTGGAPPAATTSSSAPSAATTSAAPEADPTTAEAPVDDGFVMPDEVGKNLQAAQDDIQRVSGNPVFVTTSTDATGAGRFQVLDRNWTVCAQNVAAGRKVDGDTDIDFSVVKDTETCP